MKKLNPIKIFIFLLISIFIFTDILYANDISNESSGFIILNLHWSEEEITLNSIKKFAGFMKRSGRKAITSPFFYMLLSEDGETMRAGCFKMPRKLYYDYFDESTGELTGGELQQDEFDFVIRVPYFHKAKQIMFYKSDGGSHHHTMNSKMILEESDDRKFLGRINF